MEGALVLTLVAADKQESLNDALIATISNAMSESGVTIQDTNWLDRGKAVDFNIKPNNLQAVRQKTASILSGYELDWVVQRQQYRRKSLLVADMDSTIITAECIDELADFAGLREQVSKITERAMRGELDFEAALKSRVSLLKGLDLEVLSQAYEERVTLTKGARCLVQTMKKNGAQTALVSGGFTYFTERVAKACGFDLNHGNDLLSADGKLTGLVAEPILGKEVKRNTLIDCRDQLGITAEQTLTIGDGANDLLMIEEAGLGIAYHAKPILAKSADAEIRFGDLTTVLYFQGYNGKQFANA